MPCLVPSELLHISIKNNGGVSECNLMTSPSTSWTATEELCISSLDGVNKLSCWFYKHILFQVYCIGCVADAPTKATMQNVMQFNGYYGCSWCLHPGVCVNGKETNLIVFFIVYSSFLVVCHLSWLCKVPGEYRCDARPYQARNGCGHV